MIKSSDATISRSLEQLLREGRRKQDRTGTGTLSLFGHQMRFDLARFSALDHKETAREVHHPRTAVVLRGDTNVAYLRENGVTIWDEWADARASLGRSMAGNGAPGLPDGGGIDQIAGVVEEIKRNPFSRRLIVQRLESRGSR